jgi:hypothetical protein
MRVFRSVSVAFLSLTLSCAESAGPGLFTFRPPVSDVLLSDSLRSVYREDAARLALRRLVQSGYDGIAIPPEQIRVFYDALVLVHNVSDWPPRDSVVELYRIHTFPTPATHDLLLWINAGTAWADAWSRGERFTGNPDVDGLLRTYDLTLARYFPLTGGDALVVLHSAAPINVGALAPLFAEISGVRFSEPDGVIGDGNDIRASFGDEALGLDYRLGWGDCPAGCTAGHVWTFLVSSDGTVTYLGSSGTPPPLAP